MQDVLVRFINRLEPWTGKDGHDPCPPCGSQDAQVHIARIDSITSSDKERFNE